MSRPLVRFDARGEVIEYRPPTELSLGTVVERFRRWLHLPDPTPLQVALATVIANRMDEGDPVWLVFVGASSRGKTELLGSLTGLDYVRVIGDLTPAALLSGTPARERAKTARGGLLREIPARGAILLVKDLGAVLAMPQERRISVLQALREVFDGRYTRDVGAGGGDHLEWQGRVGLIAGATGDLDRHHAVIGALGERWITLRLPAGGTREMARAALRRDDTGTMRAELADVVGKYLATVHPPDLHPLEDEERERLVALSSLATLARSPVVRDGRTREIELVPQSEGPARFARQLHKLALGLYALSLPRERVHAVLRRIALDSIGSPRRETLELMLVRRAALTTTDVATTLGLPRTTTERALEDATALGLLVRSKAGGETSANQWRPTAEALELWDCASPDMSPPQVLEEPSNPEEDISGEGPAGRPGDDPDEPQAELDRMRAKVRDAADGGTEEGA
jgi:hypothetical protein